MDLEYVKESGHYLATDEDGTIWECIREPFSNGLGKWFVKLNINEDYNDVMWKITDQKKDKKC